MQYAIRKLNKQVQRPYHAFLHYTHPNNRPSTNERYIIKGLISVSICLADHTLTCIRHTLKQCNLPRENTAHTHHTNGQLEPLRHNLSSTRYPSLLCRQRQHRMKSFPDSSTHYHLWESNSWFFDLKSNPGVQRPIHSAINPYAPSSNKGNDIRL